MDWQMIGVNIAAGLMVGLVLMRLIRRDRQDQKMIKKLNGLASDFAKCTYDVEATSSKEGVNIDVRKSL
jgi:uncharacterized membrane-anchored protein YhcB (DUF1043 family)